MALSGISAYGHVTFDRSPGGSPCYELVFAPVALIDSSSGLGLSVRIGYTVGSTMGSPGYSSMCHPGCTMLMHTWARSTGESLIMGSWLSMFTKVLSPPKVESIPVPIIRSSRLWVDTTGGGTRGCLVFVFVVLDRLFLFGLPCFIVRLVRDVCVNVNELVIRRKRAQFANRFRSVLIRFFTILCRAIKMNGNRFTRLLMVYQEFSSTFRVVLFGTFRRRFFDRVAFTIQFRVVFGCQGCCF